MSCKVFAMYPTAQMTIEKSISGIKEKPLSLVFSLCLAAVGTRILSFIDQHADSIKTFLLFVEEKRTRKKKENSIQNGYRLNEFSLIDFTVYF